MNKYPALPQDALKTIFDAESLLYKALELAIDQAVALLPDPATASLEEFQQRTLELAWFSQNLQSSRDEQGLSYWHPSDHVWYQAIDKWCDLWLHNHEYGEDPFPDLTPEEDRTFLCE